ncbi:hypothetical protein LUZ60_016134 [Juncus effusus]|nr:hypothetical protein LUZ60_016134 [Juncus effusus]
MTWSIENATKAYLQTIKSTADTPNQPNIAEFISALAAGNGAKLMVEVCHTSMGATTLALAAAASHTGGRVVCIIPSYVELHASVDLLGLEASQVEFIIGDASELLAKEYKAADFVLVDCQMDSYDRVVHVAREGMMEKRGGVVLEYNVLSRGDWRDVNFDHGAARVDLLPIGGGVRVWRVPPAVKRNRWVLCIDKHTGEEYAIRVVPPRRKLIEA